MDYKETRDKAREILSPICLVCKECNGVACAGKTPGVGSKGTGNTFKRNYNFLQRIHPVMDTIYHDEGYNIEIELFGNRYEAPIFIAPIGGIDINYGGKLTEGEYDQRIVKGAVDSGILAFTGDGANDQYFLDPLKVVEKMGGQAIPTLKPWKNPNVIEKIRIIEKLNVPAFAMDIDSAGLVHLAKSGKPVSSKSVEELKEIVQSTDLPFIIKGVMSVKTAMKAVEIGAYGIVVSNHGGRVLDNQEATTEVLREIKLAVGDKVKVFVDGGIRTGADVFKALALGADAVLIGRPYAIMAFGGGAEGVSLLTEKLKAELKETMIMTGCSKLSDITYDMISISI
ncbi:MAG: alpha-hydroxy-acid oxidizing protein [Gudongella sp.]|nr:alpha-hydroxy-acid oxidizing protein [Gudongella sp.]